MTHPVAHMLKALPSPPPSLAVDPVCVSMSGHTLLEHEALDTLVAELLPLAALLTPNTSEAALLLQHRPRSRRVGSWEVNNGQIASVKDMVRASRELLCARPASRTPQGAATGPTATRTWRMSRPSPPMRISECMGSSATVGCDMARIWRFCSRPRAVAAARGGWMIPPRCATSRSSWMSCSRQGIEAVEEREGARYSCGLIWTRRVHTGLDARSARR